MYKIASLLIALTMVGCMADFGGEDQFDVGTNEATLEASCWGQATAVFAAMGEVGEHSSSQGNPRIGLKNLAVQLYEDGMIEDDSMAALGQFVAESLDMTIDACL